MGIKQLEAEILAELRKLTGNNKIRQKDIMEWSTGTIRPEEGETLYFLPEIKVNVCVKLPVKAEKKNG
jgi:hypothetical protein